uniref:Uncharacterized protein n=1 Tax=uncultured Campylobacterota bacterium TaxID=120858 RepID=Q2YZI5_9BACT|nr:hypothetical protein [uncultured Campylobacterota bacterium]
MPDLKSLAQFISFANKDDVINNSDSINFLNIFFYLF